MDSKRHRITHNRWTGLALTGIAAAAAVSLAGCNDDDIAKPESQYGVDPILPAPHDYLVPPMNVAPAGSWSKG